MLGPSFLVLLASALVLEASVPLYAGLLYASSVQGHLYASAVLVVAALGRRVQVCASPVVEPTWLPGLALFLSRLLLPEVLPGPSS